MILETIGVYSAIVMLACIPLNLYTMLTKLELAESHLTRCIFITDIKHMLRNDIFYSGRSKRLIALTFVLLMPKIFYWRRLVNLEDIANIPTPLKLWIVVPTSIEVASIIIMVICGLLLI